MKPEWLPNQNALNNTRSDYLFELLHPALYDYLPGDKRYEEIFDSFEYLLALTYLHVVNKEHLLRGKFCRYAEPRGHLGPFSEDGWNRFPLSELVRPVVAQGSEGELLKAGFFNGSIERFEELVGIHKNLLENQTGRLVC